MITIDGSVGEGGGQILRTALALSLVTGEPFCMERIRAGREKPGLMRQHVTAIDAAKEIGRAKVEGSILGSQELSFVPGDVTPGNYQFSVGTAGSAMLVLQTILPALLVGSQPTTLTLKGGTHNPFAPPFDFLQKAFLPLINRMGPNVSASLSQAGFYPAGGGKFSVTIEPASKLSKIELLDRGEIKRRTARALLANLPPRIGERELIVVAQKLGWPKESLQIENVPSPGPGNVLVLEVESETVTEVFTGFGERGVTSEAVADRVIKDVREYLAAGVPVGEYLADQLLLPMALAGGGCFKTLPISRHTETNITIIEKFLPYRFAVERSEKEVIIGLK